MYYIIYLFIFLLLLRNEFFFNMNFKRFISEIHFLEEITLVIKDYEDFILLFKLNLGNFYVNSLLQKHSLIINNFL